jgi:sugar lactone lactonase YvrE
LQTLRGQLQPNLSVKSLTVVYTAADVAVIRKLSKKEKVLLASAIASPAAAAAFTVVYKVNHVDPYVASIDEGIASAIDELRTEAAQCSKSRFVLAGYSQGAMVMHQVLLRLEGDPGLRHLLARVAATLLIADGDKKKETAANRFGTASFQAEGIRSAIRLGERDIPSSKASSTYDICNQGDIVCDFTLPVLLNNRGEVIHESYTNSTVVKNVTRRIAAALLASGPAGPGIITTVAGNGTIGSCGDGGPATSACFDGVYGVAVDPAGNRFVADFWNNRVRRVAPNGTIITVAGNGEFGTCADGGPATGPCLAHPTAVAVDSKGNLYVASEGDHRVRKVAANGTISTLAGNGTTGFCGDGGPASAACLDDPAGLAVDAADNVYIADGASQRVRKVTVLGTISTLAGNGTAGFCGDGGPAAAACLDGPGGLAVDAANSVYIADVNNHRVRKVTPGGAISTTAGKGTAGFCGDGGTATAACLTYPQAVALDNAGTLYVADFGNFRIRKVAVGGTITTVAGNGTLGFCGDGGPATSACLSETRGLAIDAQLNLYIADDGRDGGRLRRVTP